MLSSIFGKKTDIVSESEALPGRDGPDFDIPETHTVLGTPIQPPFPDGIEVAYFALGCFWGAERIFWQMDAVYTTAAGYQGGYTPHPTYREVCSGDTGHAESVLVAYDPDKISYEELVKAFFEEHDPTQGMRQGNDVGSQYRSAIYTTTDEQLRIARTMQNEYEPMLKQAGLDEITTEIEPSGPFYYAEELHQQYLDKNPNGYCGLEGTGVSCPVPWAVTNQEVTQ